MKQLNVIIHYIAIQWILLHMFSLNVSFVEKMYFNNSNKRFSEFKLNLNKTYEQFLVF